MAISKKHSVRIVLGGLALGAVIAGGAPIAANASTTPPSTGSFAGSSLFDTPVQPPVANLIIVNDGCDTPGVQVSGVVRERMSVTLQVQGEDGLFRAVQNDNVQVRINGQVLETYTAHAIVPAGKLFAITVLPPFDTLTNYRFVATGLDDTALPYVDERFTHDNTNCTDE